MELGIIERVPENEDRKQNLYYLLRKAIFTPEKSTKLRIVYDGSARQSKTSKPLNVAIYKGSNLLKKKSTEESSSKHPLTAPLTT